MSKKKNEIDDMGLVPELFDGKHQVIPIISGGDDSIEDVSLPEVLPILTLRSSVIFPGSVTPILLAGAAGQDDNKPEYSGTPTAAFSSGNRPSNQ